MPHDRRPADVKDISFFGETFFRNRSVKFGIKTDDRRRHMYVIGKTGMGKSTLLENMIIDDIRGGRGVAVVDPHGDLVEKILDFIPSFRVNDVVYFNPADGDYPIAFNILENTNPEYKNLIASGLVGVFKKIWADSWGPRLEYILMNSILGLLETPNTTLLGLPRLLVDKKYRRKIVNNITDPVVKSFWVDEYANYNDKFRNEAIAPIQNKIGQFLSSALIRNIIAQPKSTIDIREIMDSKKIILMNLAKGRIGEENSALLGAMMITRIQLAAMSRVDIPEIYRRDFYLYVDEFQNFATESFANILSEARKYRLDITIAHQYIEQLGDEVKAAVLGNVGTMIVFRIGATDAEELEKEFEPYYMIADLVNLPKYHVYIKLMIDGVTSEPFSAKTLAPVDSGESFKNTIIQVSRERYANPRKNVEENIQKWAGFDEERTIEEAEQKKINPAKVRPGASMTLAGLPANARRVTAPEARPQAPRPSAQLAPKMPVAAEPARSPQPSPAVRSSQPQTQPQAPWQQQSRPIQQQPARQPQSPAQPFQQPTRQTQPQPAMATPPFAPPPRMPEIKPVTVQQPPRPAVQPVMPRPSRPQPMATPQTTAIPRPTPTPQPKPFSQPVPVSQPAAVVNKAPAAVVPAYQEKSTPVIKTQTEEDDVKPVNEDEVRLEKTAVPIQTGPEVSLTQALTMGVMGFNGRPVRQQPRGGNYNRDRNEGGRRDSGRNFDNRRDRDRSNNQNWQPRASATRPGQSKNTFNKPFNDQA